MSARCREGEGTCLGLKEHSRGQHTSGQSMAGSGGAREEYLEPGGLDFGARMECSDLLLSQEV